MSSSLIPWHVFFEALQEPKPKNLYEWLGRWRFTDDGAALSHGHENGETIPLSPKEKRKQAAHFRVIKGKRSRTLR
jgi:hypothetical protein